MLFHSPAEKENAWKTLEARRGLAVGFQRAASGAHQIPSMEPVTGLPGRAMEGASRHPRVLLRNHSRTGEEPVTLAIFCSMDNSLSELFN